jgi:hypothetical protein
MISSSLFDDDESADVLVAHAARGLEDPLVLADVDDVAVADLSDVHGGILWLALVSGEGHLATQVVCPSNAGTERVLGVTRRSSQTSGFGFPVSDRRFRKNCGAAHRSRDGVDVTRRLREWMTAAIRGE